MWSSSVQHEFHYSCCATKSLLGYSYFYHFEVRTGLLNGSDKNLFTISSNNLKLLKHKILISLLGCGLRCMEARSVRLQDLDFNRNDIKSPDLKVLYWNSFYKVKATIHRFKV
jgi:hypothetical protein